MLFYSHLPFVLRPSTLTSRSTPCPTEYTSLTSYPSFQYCLISLTSNIVVYEYFVVSFSVFELDCIQNSVHDQHCPAANCLLRISLRAA